MALKTGFITCIQNAIFFPFDFGMKYDQRIFENSFRYRRSHMAHVVLRQNRDRIHIQSNALNASDHIVHLVLKKTV